MSRFPWVKLTVDEIPISSMTRAEFRIYLAFAQDVNHECRIRRSIESLSYQTNLSQRSVFRAIKLLKTKDLIEVESHSGLISTYRILRGVKAGRDQ